MPTPPPALREHYRDPGCRVGTLSHVALSVWTAMPTVARIDALDRAIRALLHHRDPIGGVHLVRIPSITGGTIDDGIREALGRLYRTTRGRAGAVAIVLETDGFASAALRSMFSGVLLLTRGTLTQRVFSDAPSALAWLAPVVSRPEPDAPTAGALRDALRDALVALESG